jgi:hypothetical protein
MNIPGLSILGLDCSSRAYKYIYIYILRKVQLLKFKLGVGNSTVALPPTLTVITKDASKTKVRKKR